MIELVMVGALAVGAGVSVWRAVNERWSVRRLRRVPRATIAAAREGQPVCVVGYPVGPPPLLSPITGRGCYYWQVEVHRSDGTGGVRARESSPPSTMTIRDDSGRALVDTADARVTSDRATGLRIVPVAQSAAGPGFLARHRLKPSPTIAMSYVFQEIALTANDPVAIIGLAVREPDPSGTSERGYRDAPPTLLHLTSWRRRRLFITDDPLFISPDIDESRH